MIFENSIWAICIFTLSWPIFYSAILPLARLTRQLMGMFGNLTVSLVLLYVVAIGVAPAAADDNLWDEFKNMEVFKIRDGNTACPLPVVGQLCPVGNSVYYFRCCGELNSNCCIRLQDWLVGLIALFIVLAVITAFVNLMRCIFC